MEISSKTKQVILWLLILIGMILHFNYHVSGIFYGVDVVKPGSTGQEPNSIIIIRTLFYHLPFFWILIVMYTNSRIANLLLTIISMLYLIANAFHFIGEIKSPEKNVSQISLLLVVFIFSGVLAFEHFKAFKSFSKNIDKV